MLFTHETSADQFDPFSYGNLRGLEANIQHSSSTEMNPRDASSNSCVSVSPENFSFSWLSFQGNNCQSATLDHDKRPLSDAKQCQVACKRSKQIDHNTLLCSFEERPFNSGVEASSSALADEFVETREPDHIPENYGTTTCSSSSGIPCPTHEQTVGVESLYLPDWVTSFPGYFEDCGLVGVDNHIDEIDSPVHEYLPRKSVPIGPDHQADIPQWRPRVSANVPGASGSCADLAYSSASTSESIPRVDGSESDRWIRHCVIPMPSCSCAVDWAGGDRIDCGCSDEGSVRCARQHIMEARKSLELGLGQDKFRELGLCEMGEDVAQRWTDEEEKLFQGVVSSNPISLGMKFWDYLPHALPGKTSREFVSYYFNVFMLRKRAQQNRSDTMRVDSDDDELPGEAPLTEQEEEDPAVESPKHEHFINNSMSTEDAHEESEGKKGLMDGSCFND
uniref:Myb-like domain-containing protein n=1 Tax=Arundo donax TaxID=35708 RepID=A0A0A9DXS5_ARUDO